MEAITENAYRVVDTVSELPETAMEGSQAYVRKTDTEPGRVFVFTGDGWREFVDSSDFITREEALATFVLKGKPPKGGA